MVQHTAACKARRARLSEIEGLIDVRTGKKITMNSDFEDDGIRHVHATHLDDLMFGATTRTGRQWVDQRKP